jgi:HAE1 family hydrophobic/amphiphilic exporter-1
VPGIQVFPQVMPPIRIGGQLTKSLYQITLQSPDPDALYHDAPLLEEKMRELPGLTDVTSDLYMKNPEATVEIDRDRASALGLSAQAVEEALYSGYGDREVSTIYAPNNDYQVIMEMADGFQLDPGALSLLYVRSDAGKLVPLDSVAKVTTGVGPLLVNHSGQLPAVTISFNLAPGTALGPAVAEVEDLIRHTLPASVSSSFQGLAQAFQSSLSGLWLLLVASVLVIYIILGILYEDFFHPVTILSGLPAAGFGALITLKLFGLDLNLYAFVGLIMLVGIMKKNAIMMIDFALEAQRKGAAPREAIYQGCLVRFRPIMMTTMAALMGSLPIALGMGAGAESRRPLGLAVVGGLLVSQLLTLYVTPVFYTYVESLRSGVSNWRRAPQVPPRGHIEEGAPLSRAGDVGRGEARGLSAK